MKIPDRGGGEELEARCRGQGEQHNNGDEGENEAAGTRETGNLRTYPVS